MTYLLKYYVSAFTNTKSDHTLPIWYNNLTRWDAVLRHAQILEVQYIISLQCTVLNTDPAIQFHVSHLSINSGNLLNVINTPTL